MGMVLCVFLGGCGCGSVGEVCMYVSLQCVNRCRVEVCDCVNVSDMIYCSSLCIIMIIQDQDSIS